MSNFLCFTSKGLSIYFWIIKLLCLYLGSPSLGGLISGGTTLLVLSGLGLFSSLSSSIVSIWFLTFSTDYASFARSEEPISSSETLILFSDFPLLGLLLTLKLFLMGESCVFYFCIWSCSPSFFLGYPVQYFSISYLIYYKVLVTCIP